MIMPKAAGNLSGAIEGKGLTGKMKVEIAALLLHAVAWLASHQVMHRDIKPDNVLLTDEGKPVLTDFSLAKVPPQPQPQPEPQPPPYPQPYP